MKFEELPEFYEKLDSNFNIKNSEIDSATYTNVDSNFVYSSSYARHRWFNYKEGFSPVLVKRIFDEYHITKNDVVCDPFCGAGTTLVVAKTNGIKSIGFEVNPFAAFITRIKTENYNDRDISLFKRELDGISSINFKKEQEVPDNEYLRRIFDSEMLQVQLNIREYLFGLSKNKSSQLLFFAWLSTLEKCSLYRKAGNGLKKKTHPPKYGENGAAGFAVQCIREKANSIIEDFSVDDNGPIPRVYEDSATSIGKYIYENTLDLVLFSPPYANCFDYTKIYYLELWFGEFINSRSEQKNIRMKSIRSHCHATWPERYTNFYLKELNTELIPLVSEQKLWTNRIPSMLNGYFADMEESLKQIYATLKRGGHCAIVVSNSAYGGVVIPTDSLLAMIAKRIGFTVEEIEVERLIITSSQQYKKTEPVKKYLRESIVKIRK